MDTETTTVTAAYRARYAHAGSLLGLAADQTAHAAQTATDGNLEAAMVHAETAVAYLRAARALLISAECGD
jgi:hypothetical protein